MDTSEPECRRKKGYHPPPTHPTKDTLSSAVFPPNFWTNLIFFIDFRLCFLHNFFIYPTIEYFLELVRLCFPQNFWTNQHFFIGFFYLKSRSNMPENKGLPIFCHWFVLVFSPHFFHLANYRIFSTACTFVFPPKFLNQPTFFHLFFWFKIPN